MNSYSSVPYRIYDVDKLIDASDHINAVIRVSEIE